eukprot:2007440-Rhodomonas_salina.2
MISGCTHRSHHTDILTPSRNLKFAVGDRSSRILRSSSCVVASAWSHWHWYWSLAAGGDPQSSGPGAKRALALGPVRVPGLSRERSAP